jgi:hypothetical protein
MIGGARLRQDEPGRVAGGRLVGGVVGHGAGPVGPWER